MCKDTKHFLIMQQIIDIIIWFFGIFFVSLHNDN